LGWICALYKSTHLILSSFFFLFFLCQELQEVEQRYALTESSLMLAIGQLEQQVASRQVQVAALQAQGDNRRTALQDQRTKVSFLQVARKSALLLRSCIHPNSFICLY
jgi:hypothetical protein